MTEMLLTSFGIDSTQLTEPKVFVNYDLSIGITNIKMYLQLNSSTPKPASHPPTPPPHHPHTPPQCHIYASMNQVSIGSDNGLSHDGRQATI